MRRVIHRNSVAAVAGRGGVAAAAASSSSIVGHRRSLSIASAFPGPPPLSPFQAASPTPTFAGPNHHILAHEQVTEQPQPTSTVPPTPASPAPATFSQRLKHESYDVTIVGGGMVGSTLALALASSPITRHLRVCMIETAPPRIHAPLQAAPSIRVSAVAPASAAFFEKLGAWRLMRAKRVTPFSKMHVWHTQQRGKIEWDINQMRGETVDPTQTTGDPAALGFIVENDVLQNSIWQRMLEITQQAPTGEDTASPATAAGDECNLEILAPIKIEQILPKGQSDTNWPRLVLSNGQQISTRLLIGADGPTSLVKKYAAGAIESFGWDYPQRAVVATLKLDGHQTNDIAFQRFLPTGPIALLPCHDGYANLVWSTTPAHAKELSTAVTPQEFCQRVNQAFRADSSEFQPGGRFFDSSFLPPPLSQVASILFPPSNPASPPLVTSVIGPRLGFPLRFIHASTYVSERVALIGDAAHVMHPLAGQGVNLGFGDAEALLSVIESSVTNGVDIGTLESLRPYTAARWSHNARLMHGVDAIGRMFSINDGPVAAARAIGMDLLSAVPALKRHAAGTAMGVMPVR